MRKYDKQDAEHLEQAVRTRGYEMLRQRTEAMLEAARVKLELPQSEADTAALRGDIRTLRTILKLPAILAEEIARQRQ